MPKNDDSHRRFKAACVQFGVQRGDVAHNLAAARDGILAAAEAEARLVVLPEMWTTSFMEKSYPPATLEAAAEAEEAIRELSAQIGGVILGSGVEQDGDRIHNSARVFDCGTELGCYRKIHLFSLNAEDRHHDAGTRPLIVDTSIGRVAVLICYDLRFPELARYYFYQNAEILVVPAQWPESRSGHWRSLLRARAIENQFFVVGCNRTGTDTSLKTNEALVFPGDSRIIDPMGEPLASGAGETGALTAEIDLRKVRTMRRIMPVRKDQRPDVYRELWDDALRGVVDKGPTPPGDIS